VHLKLITKIIIEKQVMMYWTLKVQYCLTSCNLHGFSRVFVTVLIKLLVILFGEVIIIKVST